MSTNCKLYYNQKRHYTCTTSITNWFRLPSTVNRINNAAYTMQTQLNNIRLFSSNVNLTALKRIDNTIDNILYTAKHCVLYKLDNNTSRWTKQEIEGVTFIAQRNNNINNKYCIVISNRKSINNYICNVYQHMNIELNSQYLMYQVDDNNTYNLWFHDINEANIFYDIMSQIVTNYNVVKLPVQQQQQQQPHQQLSNDDTVLHNNNVNKTISKVQPQQSKQRTIPPAPITHRVVNNVLTLNVIDSQLGNKAHERQLHMQLDSFLKKLDDADNNAIKEYTNKYNKHIQKQQLQNQNNHSNDDIQHNNNHDQSTDLTAMLSKFNIKSNIKTVNNNNNVQPVRQTINDNGTDQQQNGKDHAYNKLLNTVTKPQQQQTQTIPSKLKETV